MWEGCSQPAACMHPLCAHPCVQILLCPTPSLIWISCALFGLDHRSTLIKPRSSSLRSMNKHQPRATFSMLMSSFLQVPFTWLCFPIWASSIREFTPCVKDTTLPMPVTYHNDIRRHFFHEVKQSHLGRNDLPEAYSRKPMSRQCNPWASDTSRICLFEFFFSLFRVIHLTEYLLASSKCWKGLSPGSPSTHFQSHMRIPACVQALMKSPCAELSTSTDCVWE